MVVAMSLELQIRLPACIDLVAEWMCLNRLQLSTVKTRVLWSTTSRQLHQLSQSSVRVGTNLIASAAVVRNLGIFIEAEVLIR